MWHKVEHDLKTHQLKTVKQVLFIDCIGKQLKNLPEQLSTTTYFNISSEQLKAAELQLTEKRYGLRLL